MPHINPASVGGGGGGGGVGGGGGGGSGVRACVRACVCLARPGKPCLSNAMFSDTLPSVATTTH